MHQIALSRTVKYNRGNITILVIGNIISVVAIQAVVRGVLEAVLSLLGVITEKVTRSIVRECFFLSPRGLSIFGGFGNYSG